MSEKFSGHSGDPGDLGYNGFVVSLFYLAPVSVEQISDPNVIIALKGLTRKNSVTKEKRLAEFSRMISNELIDIHDTIILMCWIQLYPRLAIDSSKTVRMLAHQIQATYLEKLGGKEFSKYLKSSIPSWLQSLYDEKTIAASSYKSLLESFASDKERVDTKIWIVFHEQIINYCHAVLVHETASSLTDERSETADDVLLKYYRAQNGAMQMLLKIITLANTIEGFVVSEQSMDQINEILGHETFWDGIGMCCAGDSINIGVFKAYLSLIKLLFAVNHEGEPNQFTLRLSDVKNIFKTVSKKFIKHVKLQAHSGSTIVYSSIMIEFWQTLTALTAVTSWKAEIRKKLKIKKNFWVLGGSKSYLRLKLYIKLGPCQSDPLYYIVLKDFFLVLAEADIQSDDDFSFISFTSSKDAKAILESSLGAQFKQIGNLNGFAYKKTCAKCLYLVFNTFQLLDSDRRKYVTYLFALVLDGLSLPTRRANEKALKVESVADLARFAEKNNIELLTFNSSLVDHFGKGDSLIVENYQFTNSLEAICDTYISTIFKLSLGSATIDDLESKTLKALEELYEPSEVSSAFETLIFLLRNTSTVSEAVEEWAGSLASYITEDFVDKPLNVLELLLERNVEMNKSEVFGDFYSKILEVANSKLPKLMEITERFGVDVRNIEEIWNYLLSLSKKRDRSDSENAIIFGILNEPEIFANVVGSSNTEVFKLDLIKNLSKRNIPFHISESLMLYFEDLIFLAVSTISSRDSQAFLALVEDKDLVSASVFRFTAERDFKDDFAAISGFIAQHSDLLPVESYYEAVTQALDSLDHSSIAIANPLGQAVHMVKSNGVHGPSLNEHVLSIGKFLLTYLQNNSANPTTTLIILVGLCAEYAQDYNFVVDVDNSSTFHLDLKNDLLAFLIGHSSIDDVGITNTFNGTIQEEGSLLFEIERSISNRGPYSSLLYYHARVLVALFEPVFEEMSLATFEALDIQYSKLAAHPLKLSVLACTARKFARETQKFDRIRGYVFGEIFGVRSSLQILNEAPTWLSLASEFLKLESFSMTTEILPKHKLGMLISHISGWLESDVAYDDEFIRIRCLLANFLALLITSCGEQLPEKTWELSVNLCLNNFATVQANSDALELKYFSMKLLLVLSKYPVEENFSVWTESKKSIIEELIDLMVNKEAEEYCSKCHNQPVFLSNDLMERILKKEKVSQKIIGDNAESLYYLLTNSKFLSMQRLAALFLEKYIWEVQDTFVIEYELLKSNLGEGNDSAPASLPDVLLHSITESSHKMEDALYSGEYFILARYLWSWLLIFAHFKNATHSIKTCYINQLKENGVMADLFSSIFAVVDVSDASFLKTLVTEPLDKNAKVNPENCKIQSYSIADGCIGESVSYEMHFVLVHLYYLSFQYLGAQVLQWFHEIRDLQLKKLVEKFSVRFVSPLLISKLLFDVEQAKAKLTEKDENLSIKISKVSNEIKSVYEIDEQTMEMVVKIPEAFPLTNVSVEGPMRLGVKENQWKAWLLASQRVVSLMNGSIIDCIELFNRNVNLHFSGFEECAICYSILHQDHSLPSKVCPTCLNKFHSACLYKWFKSSGSSTCPLCRCAFNFKAARA